MSKLFNCTKVKALDNLPSSRSDAANSSASHDRPVLNPPDPVGRIRFDNRPKIGLSRPNKSYKISTLNCRTLRTASSQAELDKLMRTYQIAITCIQEHRHVHCDSDPDIVARSLGSSTLFTSSAERNDRNAAVRGVGIAINSKLLPMLESVEKVDNPTFKGNPKTVVISCYSPHNGMPEEDVVNFYSSLSNTINNIPSHSMLIICGDMNAQIASKFSFHDNTNRNGNHLIDFSQEQNLIVGNTSFQKHRNKLWTHRSPNGSLSQIDFILFRKRWRKSFKDCQAYSSSNPVGSDHRIVSASIKLSLRSRKVSQPKKMYWRALSLDSELATRIDNTISARFESLPIVDQDYTSFVSISNKVGAELLPPKPRSKAKTVDLAPMALVRNATIQASTQNVQTAQNMLHGRRTRQQLSSDL